MNLQLLRKHVLAYLAKRKHDPELYSTELKERKERAAYYQSWTAQKLASMTADEFTEYLSKLWAMRIWGNKEFVVDGLIRDNTLPRLIAQLSDLLWSKKPIESRWDGFRKSIKGMGPAMMSELLCHTHPREFLLWNRRALVGFNYLGVPDLPRYNYQMTGQKYRELCDVGRTIENEMASLGDKDADYLGVDYFLWSELQIAESLDSIFKRLPITVPPAPIKSVDPTVPQFIHDEVRDKIEDIGTWLGFQADTEKKIAGGAVVDAIWESTIGNMGRVIYVFEVQTKGSLDSLILNLLKALNNPAVQGVVAVSDASQLERIKHEVATVTNLKDKLKYWNYIQVLEVHEALEFVNESINSLGLVPQGF